MSARSRAVQQILAEIRGALAFGRTHVVVIGDREIIRQLPEMLMEKLRGEIDAVTVRLAGQQDTVADCLAASIRDARRAAGTSAESREGRNGGRLALLLPDALAIPASSLRSLHEIATHLGAHRLVLLVERDSHDDPVAELVERLGAGVSKIEIEPLPTVRVPTLEELLGEALAGTQPAPEAEEGTATGEGGPDASAAPAVRRATRRVRRRWPRVVLATLVGAFLATPDLIDPHRHEAVPRDEAAPAPAGTGAAAPTPVVAPVSEVKPEPRKSVAARSPKSAPKPAARPKTGPKTRAGARPAAAAPREVLLVNFNAVPWAELVIDGRRLGPTPLAGVRLASGSHDVRARFPDGQIVQRKIRVDARHTRFQIR